MLRKNNIIIIDSGIDRKDESLCDNIIGGKGYSYDRNTGIVSSGEDYQDENGHGTACGHLVKRECNDIGIYAMKILDKQCRTNSKVLIEALKDTLNMDIRLINLSLATTNKSYKEEIEDVVNQLYEHGKIIVSALSSDADESYPASFKNVIGVKCDILKAKSDIYYDKTADVQCTADGRMATISGLNYEKKVIAGSSKSTAILSGMIASILNNNQNISFEELNDMLDRKLRV